MSSSLEGDVESNYGVTGEQLLSTNLQICHPSNNSTSRDERIENLDAIENFYASH